MDADPYALADEAAASLRDAGFGDHDVLLVLGSGWQPVADALGEPLVHAHMADLPGWLPPVVPGHTDDVWSFDVDGVRVLAHSGRTHLLEGHGPDPVVHGVRVAARLGCRTAVLTNSAGSLRTDWRPGTCVLVNDHINLTGQSPLAGPRFVDLSDCYSARLRAVARSVRPSFVDGVYVLHTGPSFETAAEARMMARLGGDLVGMSCVMETIAAREAEMDVLMLSMATVIEGDPTGIDPEEVLVTTHAAIGDLTPDLLQIISRLKETA